MDDTAIDSELFEILRHLAIVSAALTHNPANRDELLAQREALVQAAAALGFTISDRQQQQLLERLAAPHAGERQAGKPTQDHGDILAWALDHDAVPAEVHRPFFDHQPAALRFLSGAAKKGTPELKAISWEDFFARFDLMGLALVFDDVAGYEFIPAPPSNPDDTFPREQ